MASSVQTKARSKPLERIAEGGESLDLAAVSLSVSPMNRDVAESLSIDYKLFSSGESLRNNATKLLEGVKIPPNVLEQISNSLQGSRPEWHDRLLLAITCNLHLDTIKLFSNADSPDLKTPPIKDRASFVGCAFFIDQLIMADAALAEEILSASSDKSEELRGTLARIEKFMLSRASSELLPLALLLQSDSEEQGSLGASYLLRGGLKPYLTVAQLVPDDLAFFGFLRRTQTTVAALGDIVVSKRISKHLESFIEASQETERKAAAEKIRNDYNDQFAESKLQTIFNTLKNDYDILNTLGMYLQEKKALSVYDLALIVKKIPRAIDWGYKRNYDGVGDLSKSKNPHDNFEPADLRILYEALTKTTIADGHKLCGEVGVELRKVVQRSYPMQRDAKSDDGFKTEINTLFTNTLGKVFGNLLAK